MIPTTEVGSSIQNPFLFYVSMLGILLVVGTYLRLKVPFLKKYFIPASLIAGIIGLLLGPYFLGIIPKHITSCWSGMSGVLIVIVFAPMLMGYIGADNMAVGFVIPLLAFLYILYFALRCKSE